MILIDAFEAVRKGEILSSQVVIAIADTLHFIEEMLLAQETQQYVNKFGNTFGRILDVLDFFGLLLPFKTGHAKTDRWGTLKKKLSTSRSDRTGSIS